jgi:hypothetical protein
MIDSLGNKMEVGVQEVKDKMQDSSVGYSDAVSEEDFSLL